MYIFKNEMKLKKFIRKYLKTESGIYDYNYIKQDVIFSSMDGNTFYELRSFETKDNLPHVLDFDVKYGYDVTIIEF